MISAYSELDALSSPCILITGPIAMHNTLQNHVQCCYVLIIIVRVDAIRHVTQLLPCAAEACHVLSTLGQVNSLQLAQNYL